MIIDGTMQLKTVYESTNFRRFVTGTLFGYGMFAIIANYLVFCYNLGYNLTH